MKNKFTHKQLYKIYSTYNLDMYKCVGCRMLIRNGIIYHCIDCYFKLINEISYPPVAWLVRFSIDLESMSKEE